YTLLYPLSFLSPNHAYVLWCLLQAGLGLSALYLLSGLGALSSKDRWLFSLGVLSSFPAYACFWHGNTTFFLLGFLSAYICCFVRGKDLLAGLFLALSTFKPQYLFMMMVPAVAMRRWRVLAGFALMELVILALAIPIIGIDNVIGYPFIVVNAESDAGFIGVNAHHMISIRGLLAQFVSTSVSLKVTGIVMFLSLVPLFFVWTKLGGKREDNARAGTKSAQVLVIDPWLWASTICLAVFLSPHCHAFDFLLLAMAAALTLPSLSLLSLPKQNPLKTWTMLFILFPPLSWLLNFGLGYQKAPVLAFFPCLAFFVVLALMGLKSSRLNRIS
ncbi:MAG: DUF2029 domain-containing protein, partial [Candidatus Obscuribacterales bacterium]|nr:DUF2029 domain-containing protein [Candidatus Obscuribacterales bacterium]